MPSTHLTKSRYVAGLQCLRRLWLQVHDPMPYVEPPPGSPMAVGQEIGRHAHRLFPGGVLVDEQPWEHAEAVARTAAFMADPAVPAIFEAAFIHDDIRIRVDVLERLRHGWGLREVKSSAKVKEQYLDDIALQLHVLASAGVNVTSAQLLHVETGYVRGPGAVDWPAFFARAELLDQAERQRVALPARLPAMRDVLRQDAAPLVPPSKHCHPPYSCEYWDQCTTDKAADWIAHLPRLSAERMAALEALGITSIAAIPDDFPLTAKQVIIRDATATGKPYVSPDLSKLLHGSGPPAYYLDFEAVMPPVPLYEGTSPYQALPFQWSLHSLAADGRLAHCAFLAHGQCDPRRDFAESLIAALADGDGPIIVYSGYELGRLKALATELPDLGASLGAIMARLVDLLPVVRGGVYFPAFRFSNSIKTVGPALAPGFGYGDLTKVADGSAAAGAFLQIASGQLDATSCSTLRGALLAYCERDTLAMVEVHRALHSLA